ncbi:Mitochondrial inner membrane protein oxa1l, partial [Rhizopus stolonifer]
MLGAGMFATKRAFQSTIQHGQSLRMLSTGLMGHKKSHSLKTIAFKATKTNGSRALGLSMSHLGIRHLNTNQGPLTEPVTDSANDIVQQAVQTTAPDTLVHSAAQIGEFKALGLCNTTPVGALESMFEYIHVFSDIPWWGTIALATIAVRVALLPLMIKIQRNNAKLMNINPEVTRIMDNLKNAQSQGDTLSVDKYSQEIQGLFKKNECHPMKSLGLPLVQMPVMISFFMAIRSMADVPVPGLSNEGILWFTDLSAKDPYYILPAISAAGMMAVLEAGTETGAANPQSKGMKNVFRGLSLAVVPFTAWMPSGVFVYWITSNAFSIAQILALKSPSLRKALNIPLLVKRPQELQQNTK